MVMILFEFFTDNTNVEWSHAMTGIAGDKGLNFITTGHDKDKEPGMTALINGQLQYGYTAREFNHSHPQNTPYPSGISGFTGETGDVQWAGEVCKIFGNNVKFNIYTPKNGKYIQFSPNSKKSDYF